MKYVEAKLYKVLSDDKVKCGTCIRGCILKPGQEGFCGNYMNIDGRLYNIGYGNISAFESRPIEIKPFFHFYPGSTAMTFSGWGCNFKCRWCQNYHLSMRKPRNSVGYRIPPKDMIELAIKYRDDGLCASFNEPTIHLEYLIDVFKLSKKHGLYNTIVSNGSLTVEALELLHDSGLDAMNVDIKGCEYTYRRFLGIPNPYKILETARKALELGIHVESVFLIVTGANDSEECIKWVIENHIKYLGVDIPLHINRYYPAYKYDKPPTPIETLLKAYEIALDKGVKYVYIGNIPNTEYMNTKCPRCSEILIVRDQYRTLKCNLNGSKCPKCGYEINIKGACKPTPLRKLLWW